MLATLATFTQGSLSKKGLIHLGVTEKIGVITLKHQFYNAFYLKMAGNPRDFQP